VGARWQSTPRHARAVAEWIRREFAMRGLTPPHCTPEALARALERERQIRIEFRPHDANEPGVYGLLYHPEAYAHIYIILFRPTQNLALQRVILFHELAHILFDHPLTEVAGVGGLRGFMVSDADDALAEAFAVGAMQYSFLDVGPSTVPADAEDDRPASAFGQLLKRTQYQL
jgi:hypothetical protein